MSSRAHLACLDQRLRAGAEAPLAGSLVRQVWADGVRAVADQRGGVVGGVAGQRVHDDGGVGAQTCRHARGQVHARLGHGG